jgi:glycine amidinotransferase
MARIVNCWNEWDPLKRVIVGRADGSMIPYPEPAYKVYNPKTKKPVTNFGPIAEETIQKANEQMDYFVKIMEDRGIIVDRVKPIDFNKKIITPDFEVETMRGTMPPRDVLLPVGSEILECTMSLRSRWFEYLCCRPILEKYFKEDPEFEWVSAPKPRLNDDAYEKDFWNNYLEVWTDEEKEKRMLQRKWVLTEKQPCFDAADAARCGRDIFMQASAVTNATGIDWLKRHFGAKGIRVHDIQFGGDNYFQWHIDVDFVPLGPGLALVNPDWPIITPEANKLFQINNWELVEVPPFESIYPASTGCAYDLPDGPQCLGMNSFMLGPKTICVEAGEKKFMDLLDKRGFEVIPIPYTEVCVLGGGLHCSTVDVYREGELEDYFPNQLPGY